MPRVSTDDILFPKKKEVPKVDFNTIGEPCDPPAWLQLSQEKEGHTLTKVLRGWEKNAEPQPAQGMKVLLNFPSPKEEGDAETNASVKERAEKAVVALGGTVVDSVDEVIASKGLVIQYQFWKYVAEYVPGAPNLVVSLFKKKGQTESHFYPRPHLRHDVWMAVDLAKRQWALGIEPEMEMISKHVAYGCCELGFRGKEDQ